jgi:hypothetical protein
MKLKKTTLKCLQGHPVLTRKSPVLPTLALLSFAALPAKSAVLVSDDFTNAVRVGTSGSRTGVDVDGGTTNDWMMALANGTTANQISDANAPNVATGINGNSLATTGGTFPFSLHRYFTSTTLNAGESISVSLNIRTTAAPTAQATSFRIGLFDSNTGKISTNSNFSGATGSTAGTVFIDDRGYGAFYDTGTSPLAHVIGERTNTTYTAANGINLFRPSDFGNLGTANRQFDDFAPPAQHQFGRDEQQFVAAFDRFGVASLVFEHPHEEAPQIVNQQQHARGTLAHRRLLRTEPGEAPLVLEFVKDVLGIRALAVELDDLEGVGLVGC